jgi:hypothetical protein
MAFFIESSLVTRKLKLTAGIMVNGNTAYPDKPAIFPGIDARLPDSPGTYIYASINRALHLPTYRLVLHRSGQPGNIGLNPDQMVSLKPALSIEWSNNLTGYRILPGGEDMLTGWSYASNRYAPVNLTYYRSGGLTQYNCKCCKDPFSVNG